MNIIGLLIWLVAIYIVLMIGLVLFINHKKYCHTFVGRKMVGDNVVCYVYKAKEKVDRMGVKWWIIPGFVNKVLKLKDNKIPAPPHKAIYLKPNGKLLAEGFITERDEVVWGRLTKEKDIVQGIEPLISHEAEIQYIEQFKKANAEQGKALATIILPIAVIIIFAIVLMFFAFMWQDIAEPALQAGKISESIADSQRITVETLEKIQSDVQSIKRVSTPSQNPEDIPD